MKQRIRTMLACVPLAASPTLADDHRDRQSRGLAELDWYGGVTGSYLIGGGDVDLFGTTPSLYGGVPTLDMDDGGRVSLILGVQGPRGWRFEADLGYLTLETDTAIAGGFDDRDGDLFAVDAEIESLTFMLNAAYDFDIGSPRFTPFVKGGVGVARNEVSGATLDVDFNSPFWDGSAFEGQSIEYAYPEGDTTEFAWNLSAGLRMQLSQQFSLMFEYGYIDIGETVTGTDENGDALGFTDLGNQQLSLGLMYRF